MFTEKNLKGQKLSLGGNIDNFFLFLTKFPTFSKINDSTDTIHKVI